MEMILAMNRWLWMEYSLWIPAHPHCYKKMASLFGNRIRGYTKNSLSSFRNEDEEIVSQIRGEIISEAQSHFTLFLDQLEGFRKDLENVQATTKTFMLKIVNLDQKCGELEREGGYTNE